MSFSKELLDYAPKSKVYVTQHAFDADKGGKSPDRGARKVMKLSKETMEQAAKELGQIAARTKLERREREEGKLPEKERKNATFDMKSNKELLQLGKLLEEDNYKAKEPWMYLSGNNKWVAVRLALSHFKDLVDLSLATHKLSAQIHRSGELKLCADQAGTNMVPVIKRGRRLPRLVIDITLLDSELPESLTMEEYVAEVKQLMDTAQRELYKAQEKYRKDNMERENAKRRDEHYLVGGKVLFYNRLVGDEQDPSKLKLRAALHEMKEANGDIYTLKYVSHRKWRGEPTLGSLSDIEVEMLRIWTKRSRTHPRLSEQQEKYLARCAKVDL